MILNNYKKFLIYLSLLLFFLLLSLLSNEEKQRIQKFKLAKIRDFKRN